MNPSQTSCKTQYHAQWKLVCLDRKIQYKGHRTAQPSMLIWQWFLLFSLFYRVVEAESSSDHDKSLELCAWSLVQSDIIVMCSTQRQAPQ